MLTDTDEICGMPASEWHARERLRKRQRARAKQNERKRQDRAEIKMASQGRKSAGIRHVMRERVQAPATAFEPEVDRIEYRDDGSKVFVRMGVSPFGHPMAIRLAHITLQHEGAWR